MNSSGEAQLDRAATSAVWNCRFRPYQHEGRIQEVYAMFRFSFRIY
jgi:TonB family protein